MQRNSTLVYSSTHANMVRAMARVHGAPMAEPRRSRPCHNRSVEPHELGEFPMTCYPCHVHADS